MASVIESNPANIAFDDFCKRMGVDQEKITSLHRWIWSVKYENSAVESGDCQFRVGLVHYRQDIWLNFFKHVIEYDKGGLKKIMEIFQIAILYYKEDDIQIISFTAKKK